MRVRSSHLSVLFIFLAGCAQITAAAPDYSALPTPTSAPTESPDPTLEIREPTAEDLAEFSKIEIRGDDGCRTDTHRALVLLKDKALEHYRNVLKYIGIVECKTEGPTLIWNEDPPRMEVIVATRNAGSKWYAGSLTHEACHGWQHSKDYHSEHPPDGFGSPAAERECISHQYNALVLLDADPATLEYVKNQDGTH